METRPRFIVPSDGLERPGIPSKKVHVGKDQEKAQSENDSYNQN